jgi:hypothetical protein
MQQKETAGKTDCGNVYGVSTKEGVQIFSPKVSQGIMNHYAKQSARNPRARPYSA